MPEFISTYQGITYKVPGSDKYARFKQGRLATQDEQVASYLRQHSDYGTTLTEIEQPKKAFIVGVDICPECGKTLKGETLEEHIEKNHPRKGKKGVVV